MSRNQRSRRPDSKQMWEEQDKRAPIPSRERDEPRRDDPRRDDRNVRSREDRDHDRDRNRRYRSRSPRGGRDERGGRDQRPRGGDRERERDRDARREDWDSRAGGRRSRDKDEGLKDSRRDRERERAPPTHRDRQERPRSRDRARDGYNSHRDNRSRSPRPDTRFSKEPSQPRSSHIKSRSASPASNEPHVQPEQMDIEPGTKKTGKNIKVKKEKAPAKEDSDEDDIVVEDDGMGDMAAMMGFGGFGTTQNQRVDGNNIGAVRREKKTEYRQYMNRVGGFNRPLSPPRGD